MTERTCIVSVGTSDPDLPRTPKSRPGFGLKTHEPNDRWVGNTRAISHPWDSGALAAVDIFTTDFSAAAFSSRGSALIIEAAP